MKYPIHGNIVSLSFLHPVLFPCLMGTNIIVGWVVQTFYDIFIVQMTTDYTRESKQKLEMLQLIYRWEGMVIIFRQYCIVKHSKHGGKQHWKLTHLSLFSMGASESHWTVYWVILSTSANGWQSWGSLNCDYWWAEIFTLWKSCCRDVRLWSK